MLGSQQLTPWQSIENQLNIDEGYLQEQYPARPINRQRKQAIIKRKSALSSYKLPKLQQQPHKSTNLLPIPSSSKQDRSREQDGKKFMILKSRQVRMKNLCLLGSHHYSSQQKIDKNGISYQCLLKRLTIKDEHSNHSVNKKPSTPFLFNRMKSFIDSKQNEKISQDKVKTERESKFNRIDIKLKKQKKTSLRRININNQISPKQMDSMSISQLSDKQRILNKLKERAVINNITLFRDNETQDAQESPSKKIMKKERKNAQKLHFVDKYLDKYR